MERNMTSIAFANRAADATQAASEPSPAHFRETVTIQSLVSPVSEEEFLARYWEKKPLIVHREDPGYYGDLFTLQDFDESITGVPVTSRPPKPLPRTGQASRRNSARPWSGFFGHA